MPEDRQEIGSMAKDNAGSPVVWLTLEKVLEGIGKHVKNVAVLILIILSAGKEWFCDVCYVHIGEMLTTLVNWSARTRDWVYNEYTLRLWWR